MRLAFFGTPEFAVPSLEALPAAGHDIAVVVTQPDRPSGRRRRPAPPPVKTAAEALSLPVRQPENCNAPDALAELAALKLDAIIVAAFGQKLGRRLLRLPPLGCINVHASLLPRHRGAAPVAHAILAGDQHTGVTIMQMTSRMDAGDILLQSSTSIGPRETAGELTDRLARLGAETLVEALDRLDAGTLEAQPQDEAEATLAPSLRKADGVIDWSRTAAELDRFVRGMAPWPGAYTFWNPPGKSPMRLAIHEAEAEPGSPGSPGRIAAIDEHGIGVETGGGLLWVRVLQPAGKRPMAAADFLRGHPVEVGSSLGWSEAAFRPAR